MSLKLGNLVGIPVTLHYTWFIAFLLFSWTLAVAYMPQTYPGLSMPVYWFIGIISTLILFGSVLVHELSHSYLARRSGLPVSSISLFIFGGVSQIVEEPKSPGVEFKVAIVGPLTSFIIALVLALLADVLESAGVGGVMVLAPLTYGSYINLLLGGFNLLPAYPLDGGRVLRAGLWGRMGDVVKATNIATRIGVGFSYLLMLGGFFMLIFGGSLFSGLWLILIGWFLKNGSESSQRQVVVSEALSDYRVRDVMTTRVHSIRPSTSVRGIVDRLFKYKHGGFPVVEGRKLLGFVTMEDVKRIPKGSWDKITASDIMTAREKLTVADPDDAVFDAMMTMSQQRIGRLPVVEDGKLIGIITRSDLMHVIKMRSELGA